MKKNKLVADIDWMDDEAGGALVRFGLLGRGTHKGSWRLYLRPDLSEYIEFREADLLHVQQLQPRESSLGGSVVWLKPNAKLLRTSLRAPEVQADFLNGPVTSKFLAGTRATDSGGDGDTWTIIETVVSYIFHCFPRVTDLICPRSWGCI